MSDADGVIWQGSGCVVLSYSTAVSAVAGCGVAHSGMCVCNIYGLDTLLCVVMGNVVSAGPMLQCMLKHRHKFALRSPRNDPLYLLPITAQTCPVHSRATMQRAALKCIDMHDTAVSLQ